MVVDCKFKSIVAKANRHDWKNVTFISVFYISFSQTDRSFHEKNSRVWKMFLNFLQRRELCFCFFSFWTRRRHSCILFQIWKALWKSEKDYEKKRRCDWMKTIGNYMKNINDKFINKFLMINLYWWMLSFKSLVKNRKLLLLFAASECFSQLLDSFSESCACV